MTPLPRGSRRNVQRGVIEMAPYQQRVVDEKAELDSRTESLEKFFDTQTFQDLDSGEQSLLHQQHRAMKLYSHILGDRIRAFNL